METNTSNKKKLDQCTATAVPAKRKKSQKQSVIVPDFAKKEKFPKPVRRTGYYEQTLSEYYREEFLYNGNLVLYYRFNNLDFDEIYHSAYINGVKSIECMRNCDYDAAVNIFENSVKDFYEKNKTKYL